MKWLKVAGLSISITMVLTIAHSYNVYRSKIPLGVSLAGIPMGWMGEEEAMRLIEQTFSSPLVLHYLDESITLLPEEVGFHVGADEMLEDVHKWKEESGFVKFLLAHLIRKPLSSTDIPLRADFSLAEIERFLEGVASLHDQPLLEPQPLVETMSFSRGRPGRHLNVERSVPLVIQALKSATRREANLVVDVLEPQEPDIELLKALIEARLEEFPGIAGVFIRGLESGEELEINADVAFSGMSIVKVAIVKEVYRSLSSPPDIEMKRLLTETMTVSGNYTSNLLLAKIGEGDAYLGAKKLTESMRHLGLVNTFMASPYGGEAPPPNIITPANSRKDVNAEPDPYIQTTPKESGLLLEMIYQCAKGGGTLIAAYPDEFTPSECEDMLHMMEANRIGMFIEEGLPEGTRVAHKHGMIADTHADVGLVFSPGGNYIISIFLYHQDWLDLDISSALISDISKAAYNYFNTGKRIEG
jgi:beta-lactamase class A